MFGSYNRVPEHEARGQWWRLNVDSERESLWAGVDGLSWTQPSVHEGHAIGGIRDEGKEGGKTPHQPEHGIWPSARAVYQLSAVTAQGIGEMGDNVQRAGPDQANKKR